LCILVVEKLGMLIARLVHLCRADPDHGDICELEARARGSVPDAKLVTMDPAPLVRVEVPFPQRMNAKDLR
jgi:hypothetical protein